MTKKELASRTLKWAKEKGILDKGNKCVQTLKLVEELDEFVEAAYLEFKEEAIVDAIGDCLVVMTSICYFIGEDISTIKPLDRYRSILGLLSDVSKGIIKDKNAEVIEAFALIIARFEGTAGILGYTIEYCWEEALKVIEKRTGTMSLTGDFIKDAPAGIITTDGDFKPMENE
ncbi:MAG: hypothetical protein AB7D38_12135 [Sulfurimonas sp.]|uniref:hypothetical protein n=1 Tax=Sulfurimonas sp. TaxID=2022749 RepID=UPI003D0DE55C